MSFTVAQLPSISSISSTYLTPAVNSVEPSCCDYLVARISAIWQAFCTLLSEWVGWFFVSRSQNDGVACKQGTPVTTLIKRIRENEILPDREGMEAAYAQFAKELIDAYVKAGENLEDKYVTEFTGGGAALHYAVGVAMDGNAEYLEVAKILIADEVNLEVEDYVGRTPLGIVLRTDRYKERSWLQNLFMDPCFMDLCDFPDLTLADLLLRSGANLGAKFSKQDPTTLFEEASNLKKRLQYPHFDVMITEFMADRLKVIDESTPLPIPALRQIVSDYLCEGRFDPMPLALKLSAALFYAEFRFSPNTRRLIIQYTLEAEEVTATISAQIESMPIMIVDGSCTREYFEK